jgi:hypothetical protein
MKEKTVWDFSHCNIGHPCKECVETCSFKITYSRVDDQDEKENKNERTIEEHERRN